MMKKQAQKKVAHKINAYLIKNITGIKFCIAQTLISEDILIQTTNKKKAEKLRKKDSWIRMLENKAKLAWKQYVIVILGVFIAKINLEKGEKIKEKIILQNASMCIRIKIESIY